MMPWAFTFGVDKNCMDYTEMLYGENVMNEIMKTVFIVIIGSILKVLGNISVGCWTRDMTLGISG